MDQAEKTQTVEISRLNQICTDSDSADKELQSEQRSNVLLVAGEHYSKKTGNYSFANRVKNDPNLSKEQKIRLTKNHIKRLILAYVNTVTSYAPGAKAFPTNESSLASTKSSELHNAVISYLKNKLDLGRKKDLYAFDFFTNGEVGVVATWNPNKGDFIGYKQVVDEETGEPQFDEWGRPLPGDEPVFSGAFELKRFFSWNVIRPKDCQTQEDAEFWGFKELVSTDLLKREYASDEEKLKFVKGAGTSDKFTVFDPGNGSYSTAKDCTEVRNLYWKPSMEFPQGWYSISTNLGTLEEGPLPGGIYPLVTEPCDEFQSSCRGRSPIKTWRPYQAEINRASSKMAEHQITLGDDKLVLSNGSKITDGAKLPGIRSINTSGAAPTVIPGRTGEQYLNYILSQTTELYTVAMMKELLEEKVGSQVDSYTELFKSLRQRRQFSVYTNKFERFIVRLYTTLVELARFYLPDDTLITAVGKDEAINIREFKESTTQNYSIKLEPMSDDIDTVMGKQLSLNHILQYTGAQLSPQQIGKLVSEMPLIPEGERVFSDLRINEENATNVVLSLDRGIQPQVSPQMDKKYLLQRLSSRQLKPDYMSLNPQIQAMYDQYIVQIQQADAMELQNIKAMEADMIPAKGFLTPCDFYVPDPTGEGKTRRARLPIDALGWLVERLAQQGMTLDQLEAQPQATQSGVAQQYAGSMGTQARVGEEMSPGSDSAQNAQGGATHGNRNAGSGSFRI